LCTKKETEFESLHKKRQLDLIKFQLTYKIFFYVLSAGLELAFFLYHHQSAVSQGTELFFPLDYFASIPLGCIGCISLWSTYVVFFVVVMKIISLYSQRIKTRQEESCATEPFRVLPETPLSASDEKKLD